DRQEDGHQDEEYQQGDQRLLTDLTSPGSAHCAVADHLRAWLTVHPERLELVVESVFQLECASDVQRLGADQDARRVPGTDRLHRDRWPPDGPREDLLRLRDTDLAVRPLRRQLDPGATLEVNPEVEAAQQNGREADHDEHRGEHVPPSP